MEDLVAEQLKIDGLQIDIYNAKQSNSANGSTQPCSCAWILEQPQLKQLDSPHERRASFKINFIQSSPESGALAPGKPSSETSLLSSSPLQTLQKNGTSAQSPYRMKRGHPTWRICSAVEDLDNDGLNDLIVGHYSPVQIKNTGSSFIDVTKEYGIFEENAVKSAAVADMDNDGDQDIVFW